MKARVLINSHPSAEGYARTYCFEQKAHITAHQCEEEGHDWVNVEPCDGWCASVVGYEDATLFSKEEAKLRLFLKNMGLPDPE